MTIAELGRQARGVFELIGRCTSLGMTPAGVIEYERTLHVGRVVGLTEEQTVEVYEAHRDFNGARNRPVDWERLRSAAVKRALGDLWDPEDVRYWYGRPPQ